jgi:outer membrane protein OmpA-like peptidoglycan-associated protein
MKKQFIIICYLLVSFSSFGQLGKLKKADAYYDKLAYSYAAELYEQLINSEVDSPLLKSKIATCYYHMGVMDKAETYFASMITTNFAVKEDFFFYAQALKQNGKYKESDQWMTKINQLASSDIRAASFMNNTSYLGDIENQGTHFEIKNLKCNSNASDFGAYPSNNEKEIYFISARKTPIMIQYEWTWNGTQFLDIYKSTIVEKGELENISILTNKVNTRFHEGPLCFSPDGKFVYYTRNNISKINNRKDNKGIQNLQLFRSNIDSLGHWVSEEILPFNSKYYSVGHPSISSDGKTLYFVSDMPGGFGGADLYKVSISENGKLGKLENLGSDFNTEAQEMFPWVNQKGELFFSSNGHIGLGGLDIFLMTLDKNGTFYKLQNVGIPVNSQSDDFAFTMNKNNLTGYFSSNRIGGKGDDDIYSYTLTKPLPNQIIVEGVISDEKTGEIFANKKVEIINSIGEVIGSAMTDSSGAYAFNIEADMDYIISVKNIDYYTDNQRNITTTNLKPTNETLIADIALLKKEIIATGFVYKDTSSEIIIGASVSLLNAQGEIIASTVTDSLGAYSFQIEHNNDYSISVSEKDNYWENKIALTSKNVGPNINQLNGPVSVNPKLNLSLYCLVKDSKSLMPLEGVSIIVTNNDTKKTFISQLTSSLGTLEKEIFDKEISDSLSYSIQLEKEGYLTKKLTFNHKIEELGRINLSETLDLSMDKVSLDLDLASIIQINPIYFDLRKFDIRPDAAIELDKIVKVMNDNPTMQIELGSHTDCRGTIAFNNNLSNNRAKASVQYIQKQITNPKRIFGNGYGESQLKVNCPCEGEIISTCSDEEHQQNRRTEFVIKKM